MSATGCGAAEEAVSTPAVPHVYPYTDAPMLPPDGEIDPATIVPGTSTPVEIEIGPGRGGFLFERLAADPAARMIGLEIRRKWATLVDRRLAERGFGERARVFAEDARFALPRFRAASARVVFLHFPDPWWKKRHEKRVVASPDFLRQIARVLVEGGELYFQSDVRERAEQFEARVSAEAAFAPWGEGPYVEENPYGARSPREHRAIADGLPVSRLRYRRLPVPPP